MLKPTDISRETNGHILRVNRPQEKEKDRTTIKKERRKNNE